MFVGRPSVSTGTKLSDQVLKNRDRVGYHLCIARLGANDPSEIVFTSCGSESDNWAIGGFLEQNPSRRHIITTRVEHEAVRNLCGHN